jgi:CDP-diacylglycerol--glycerol-3-phosphate 3-phosphatidyltransferase
MHPVPTRDEYFDRWSTLHGGYDPRSSRLTGGWLTFAYAVARPLAGLRVSPDLLTLFGLLVAGLVVVFAARGGRWVLLSALVVVISALLDNLDGAVAVMTDRVTKWGYVLDSVVDRLCDALFLVALWVVGAPAWMAVVGGTIMGVHEYARARAGAAGLSEIGLVTVWERPTRVIVTAMFLLGAGLYLDSAADWARAGAVAWIALGCIGFAQLAVMLRRRLSS